MYHISADMPLGIFDSGVGGLTVMKEIIRQLPGENILYLGDTARVPYGARSSETVLKYSTQNAQFLLSRGIKVLVVACNTSSAVSLDRLTETLPVPVVGVVYPGARAAVRMTRIKKVAVIGTETTINSGSYKAAIKSIDDSIQVSGIACPLFVPLIEEGWLHGEIVGLTVKKYLSPLRNDSADTLVLGCTHYPMIKQVIKDTLDIPLIDSAVETAKEVKEILNKKGIRRGAGAPVSRKFFVTDAPQKFRKIGERFLEDSITDIVKIDLEDI